MLAQIDEPNVRTVVGRAEDVDASWGRFDLVTAGRSFHWFDADVMFARLPLVTDQLALLGDSITQSDAQSRVLAIATELLGEEPPKPRRRFYASCSRRRRSRTSRRSMSTPSERGRPTR